MAIQATSGPDAKWWSTVSSSSLSREHGVAHTTPEPVNASETLLEIN